MPRREIKNTFSGGKMNKDLDERLIPNGEYRDAMNVQVTTSDSSDVGSLHNIMGNYQIPTSIGQHSIPNSVNATCIGSVVDEKNDKLYWMVEGLGDFPIPTTINPPSHYKADAIAEYDYNANNVKPVVVDVYEIQLGGIDVGPTTTDILNVSNTINAAYCSHIREGMIVNGFDELGNLLFQTNVNGVTITIPPLVSVTLDIDISTFLVTLDRIVFTSERALNFAKNPNTGKHYLITGINIIDKQLFWTDDNSEPKRVHIERYRDIGTTNFISHSFTPTRDFTQTQLAYINIFALIEEHITVIRQKPLLAPQLLMDNSTGEGITEGEIINDVNAAGDSINQISLFDEGDIAWIDFAIPSPDFQIGNILVLTSTDAVTNLVKEMRVKVTQIDNSTTPPTFKIEILKADSGITIADIDWHAELEQDKPLFEFKFPRFATRYKYEDGEYSAFSPFSEVAFLPDRPGGNDFDFVAYKGYNIGMTNQIRKLALKDFIPEKDLLPDDVIEIDILYKESDSTSIYSILSIKPDEVAWQTRVWYTGNRVNTSVYPYTFSGVKGYLPIESEMIYGILPENQLLRPWDNVPRKAKAQEVSGSRLIYGNYLQNYDLLDTNDNIITPSISINLRHYNVSKNNEDLSPEQVYPTDSYKYSPSKSIKSLRTYQLGVTYIDKYGRETPILTDNNEKKVSIYLNEWYSDKQVKITGQITSNPPEWAKYQKFFIKETSNEYYNLALDRWYDAEDGNLWLSFPSSERNKVDIDTYLILKKEHDNNNPVLEEARYRILAIENEAPEYIKTREIPIGTCDDDVASSYAAFPPPTNNSLGRTFGPNLGVGFPKENSSFVELEEDTFDGNIVWGAQTIKDDIYVRFKADNAWTEWYEVTHAIDSTSSGTAAFHGVWKLEFDRAMGDDANILTNDPVDPWNEKKSPIHAQFIQKRAYNKPEFDGRFFVKIHGDGVINEKIVKPNLNSETYQQVSSISCQYINTLPWQYSPANYTGGMGGPMEQEPLTSYGGGNPLHNNGGHGWWLQEAARAHYYPNLWDGWSTVGTPNSFEPPLWRVSSQDDSSAFDFWTKMEEETSGWFIDRTPAFGVHAWNTAGNPHFDAWTTEPGMGDNSNPRPSWAPKNRGIHGNNDSFAANKWSIDLSYTGVHDTDFNDWKDNGIDMNRWASNYVAELEFVNKLTTAGTLWRWQEDPDKTVYITTSTTSGSVFETPNASSDNQIDYTERKWKVGAQMQSYDSWNIRNTWRVHAKQFINNGAIGNTPSGYLPTNNPNFAPRFNNAGDVITTNPVTGTAFTDPAPGIRWDGMATGQDLTSSLAYPGSTIPPYKKWDASPTVNDETNWSLAPGTVTWSIITPGTLTELKYSSHNPAIFETEPKENLDLEIYHEVGQTYPLEYNRKTNELYTPEGSVVECWRSDNTAFVLNNPTWNPTAGGYPGIGTPGSATNQPTPVGNINNNGGIGAYSFTTPIIVSQVGDDTVTLIDDTGVPFQNNQNWPIEHILPGDHLKFIRPDGSSTSAIVTTISGNVYTLDPNISNRTMVLPWFNSYSFGNGVESNRIRDDYNQVTIDKGPKVSTVLSEPYEEERKLNGLIYSGIYNSTSGINNLNQFIQAEKITKDLNPTFGSIQKLFQKRINLVTFCEDRVVQVLSNKDALYNADGNSQVTATSRVLGDATPYSGEFGISKNPESFASENYRAYFTDKQRGAVMRLSQDGLTAISSHGMTDWFRDKLLLSDRLIGGFDTQKKEYNLTLPDIAKTVSFKEDVKGWVSFRSFIPENSISLTGNYYTFNKGNIWRHHATSDSWSSSVDFNTFYNVHTPSHVTVMLTADPKFIKNYQTLNYEGTQTDVKRNVEYTNTRDNVVYTDPDYYNLELPDIFNDFNKGWYVEDIHTDMQDGSVPEFIEKEGKWFNYIKGKEIPVNAAGNIASNFNYDPNEFSWQGIGLSGTTVTSQIPGCMDPNATNYLAIAEIDDGSCVYPPGSNGCTDPNACNYDSAAWIDDGSCLYKGCREDGWYNTATCPPGASCFDCNCDDINAVDANGLPTYVPQLGYNSCCSSLVYGCLDQSAFNHDIDANTPCSDDHLGCTSIPLSNIYQVPACIGPASTGNGVCCVGVILGCTDSTANNYNPLANTDDGSCSYATPSWDCDGGACIDPGNGSGTYSTLTACQSACTTPTCSITNAVWNPTGGPLGTITFDYNFTGWQPGHSLTYHVTSNTFGQLISGSTIQNTFPGGTPPVSGANTGVTTPQFFVPGAAPQQMYIIIAHLDGNNDTVCISNLSYVTT